MCCVFFCTRERYEDSDPVREENKMNGIGVDGQGVGRRGKRNGRFVNYAQCDLLFFRHHCVRLCHFDLNHLQ